MLKPKKRQEQQEQPSQKQDEQKDSASKPDVPPKLPPTHPPATGQHSEPQVALPKPGAASAPDAGSEGAAKDQLQKQGEDKAPVSPAAPTPIAKDDAPKSEPVSAVSTDHDKPLPPPKTDGASDEVKAAGMSQADPASMMHKRITKLTRFYEAPLPSQPSTQPSAKDPQPTTSENAKPIGTVPSPVTATEAQPATRASSESARVIDEKMPVMAEEPPEIKTKAPAAGMSATSGPLDDFPIEEDKP